MRVWKTKIYIKIIKVYFSSSGETRVTCGQTITTEELITDDGVSEGKISIYLSILTGFFSCLTQS